MKKLFWLKYTKKLWIAVSIIWVLVIWGHSMMPAAVSSGESNFVLEGLNSFLSKICADWQLTSFIVRKAGHFMEFFILGVLLTKTLRSAFQRWPLPFDSCAISTGLLIAICDEGIQYFTPGRASLISDVMIDFSGVVSAVVICFILRKLFTDRGQAPGRSLH